jgi:hypothetical protein
MLNEIKGNIFDYHDTAHKWIIIPTNGVVKSDGTLTMGKGIALGIKRKFPAASYELGKFVTKGGNHCYPLQGYNIISCPTKNDWHDKSTLELLERSLIELRGIILFLIETFKKFHKEVPTFYCPKLGCGEGGLDWVLVKPLLEKYIGDLVTLVFLD